MAVRSNNVIGSVNKINVEHWGIEQKWVQDFQKRGFCEKGDPGAQWNEIHTFFMIKMLKTRILKQGDRNLPPHPPGSALWMLRK